jgi:hypothetical protein
MGWHRYLTLLQELNATEDQRARTLAAIVSFWRHSALVRIMRTQSAVAAHVCVLIRSGERARQHWALTVDQWTNCRVLHPRTVVAWALDPERASLLSSCAVALSLVYRFVASDRGGGANAGPRFGRRWRRRWARRSTASTSCAPTRMLRRW